MTNEMRPRHYARQIMNLPEDDVEGRKRIFQSVPEEFKSLVIFYVVDAQAKKEGRKILKK